MVWLPLQNGSSEKAQHLAGRGNSASAEGMYHTREQEPLNSTVDSGSVLMLPLDKLAVVRSESTAKVRGKKLANRHHCALSARRDSSN